jgi:hypothetical protein
VVFTDGAKHVTDYGSAYWLLDEIALIQPYEKRVAAEEFQVLDAQGRCGAPHRANSPARTGNGNKVFEKVLAFSDFRSPTSRSG